MHLRKHYDYFHVFGALTRWFPHLDYRAGLWVCLRTPYKGTGRASKLKKFSSSRSLMGLLATLREPRALPQNVKKSVECTARAT